VHLEGKRAVNPLAVQHTNGSLQVVAMGFVRYLRDPWNWIDFVTTVAGVMELLQQVTVSHSNGE
jgi:hypothetical protein